MQTAIQTPIFFHGFQKVIKNTIITPSLQIFSSVLYHLMGPAGLSFASLSWNSPSQASNHHGV